MNFNNNSHDGTNNSNPSSDSNHEVKLTTTSNQPIQAEPTINGVPQSLHQSIIDLRKKVSNKCEVSANHFGAIYYEKTDLLKVLFPNKNWDSMLASTNKVVSKKGSLYDLEVLFRNHFDQAELDLIDKVINIPERLCSKPEIIGIEKVYSVPFDKYYNYIQAGGFLFKVNNTNIIDNDGALKVGQISTDQFFIEYYRLNEEEAVVKNWLPKFKRVVSPFHYVLDFLSKDEFDNHHRELQFRESLQKV